MRFDLVTPEKSLMSCEASYADAPGAEGYFGVLPGHSPFISTMNAGIVNVEKEGAEKQAFYVSSGFVDVTPEGVTVLAEEAYAASEMTASKLAEEIAALTSAIASAKTEAEKHTLEKRKAAFQAWQATSQA